MTMPEFKAWFEGFTEAMTGPPDADQWARIKQRVAEMEVPTAVVRPWVTGMSSMSPQTSWTAAGGTNCANNVGLTK